MNRGGVIKSIIRFIYENRWGLVLFAIIASAMYVPAMAAIREDLKPAAVWVTLLLLACGGCLTIVMRAGETVRESWSEAGSKVRSRGYAVAAGLLICLIAALATAGIYHTAIKPLDPQPVAVSEESGEEMYAGDDPEELELYDEQTVQESEEEDPLSDTTVDKSEKDEEVSPKSVVGIVCAVLAFAFLLRRFGRRVAIKASKRISEARRSREIASACGSRQVVLAFRDICLRLSENGMPRQPAMTATEYAKAVRDHFSDGQADLLDDGKADLLRTAELYEKIMYGGYEPSAEECEEVLRDRETLCC